MPITEQTQRQEKGQEQIAGHSLEHWIVKYWTTRLHPNWLRRLEGVFILPGIFQGQTQTKTDYTIPKGKPVLFSPINFITGADMNNDKEEIDIIQDLNIFLDGELVSDQCVRAASEPFRLGRRRVRTDGYWFVFTPTEGEHSITSFSSCRLGKIQIPLEYHLTVR